MLILVGPLLLHVILALGHPFLEGLPNVSLSIPDRAPDQVGRASTYGRHKDSRKQSLMAAAPDYRLNQTMHVCAHRTERFGTVLLVQSVSTRRATLCRVMDRGPYGAVDPNTEEWFNKAREPQRPGAFRGVLDMSPGTRAALGDGDGGLPYVRIWRVYRPAKPFRIPKKKKIGHRPGRSHEAKSNT